MTTQRYDYTALKLQYVEAEPKMSIRELCLANGIPDTKRSSIQRKAIAEAWDGLREKRIALSETHIAEQIAERTARRQLRRMQVEDNAIDAIDEAITKMRSDMTRTKKEQDPETKEYVLVPAVTYRPEQVVQLMDRIKGFFDGTVVPDGDDRATSQPPALTQINFNDFDPANPEHRALAAEIVSRTRGAGGPARGTPGSSPLPDAPGAGSDEQPRRVVRDR